MLQKDIYKKPIEREVNPAVSASDMKPEVVNVEIDEYVFTDEIVIGLYEVMDGIRQGNVSHNGIWINGFYGSGKSHFLKYLRYLFHKDYAEKAFNRLVDAVKEWTKGKVTRCTKEAYNCIKIANLWVMLQHPLKLFH